MHAMPLYLLQRSAAAHHDLFRFLFEFAIRSEPRAAPMMPPTTPRDMIRLAATSALVRPAHGHTHLEQEWFMVAVYLQ